MNPLFILGVLLAASMIGNIWLFNSRDNAVTLAATNAATANTNLETANQCSRSVASLQEAAEKARAESQRLRDEAAAASKMKKGEGTQIISIQRSTPSNECKSVSDLLQGWNQSRQQK